MNNNAQMMVLEAILFSITVVLALFFIVQLSPTSIQNSIDTTNDLQILADNALHSLYTEQGSVQSRGSEYSSRTETNNPTSKLVVCIICNNYTELVNSLNDYLPINVFYNLYISNGTITKFICSSGNPITQKLPPIEPVVVSHFLIAIDPVHLTEFEGVYGGDESIIQEAFENYKQSTYDVILELWSV